MVNPSEEYQHFDSKSKQREIILITGAGGFIGRRLVEKLAENYMIISLDKSDPTYTHDYVKFLYFDLTDRESISAALKNIRLNYGSKIASIIHLAAFYSPNSRFDQRYNAVNVQGTKIFLDYLHEFDVSQFIFASTALIYVPVKKGEKLNEKAGINSKWGYPTSKILTEDLILKYDGKFNSVILRIAEVYDNYGNSARLSEQIKAIDNNKISSHFYYGNSNLGLAFVHLEDVLRAITKLIEKRKDFDDHTIINIGESYSPSYGTLQKTISTLIHKKPWRTYKLPLWIAKVSSGLLNLIQTRYTKPWMIEQLDEHYELDTTKARKLLNWKPRHTLLRTMPIIIGNLKHHPDEWYKQNILTGAH